MLLLTHALLLASPVSPKPQESAILLREGDLIEGRELGYSGGATIDDDGHWWTRVHAKEGVDEWIPYLLRDGSSWLRAGQRITHPSAQVFHPGEPVGSSANRTVIVVLDDIQPPPLVSGPRAAVLRNERAILIQGELLQVAGLPPDARCGQIDAVAANTTDTVVASLQVAGNSMLVRVRFAPDGSELVRERVLSEGDDLGAGRIVAGFARVALDERGEWLVRVALDAGGTCLVHSGGVVLASGDTSPILGRNIAAVLRYADNDELGRYAAAVRLDGDPASDELLIVDGLALAQEGELIPSLSPLVPPQPLVEIGPVRLTRAGAAFWLGATQAGSLARGSFLRGKTPFLQTGVSTIAGETVDSFYPSANHFEISPNGRYWLGRVLLGTDEAYVRVDFGTSEPRGGCLGNPGRLSHLDGLVLPGRTLSFELDAPAPLGAVARLHFSSQGPEELFGCGLAHPFGELLALPAGNLGAIVAGSYSGTPLASSLSIPPSLALVDLAFFAQGSFLAPGSVTLTNGLRFEIGAP